jgi:hypothetical protein
LQLRILWGRDTSEEHEEEEEEEEEEKEEGVSSNEIRAITWI